MKVTLVICSLVLAALIGFISYQYNDNSKPYVQNFRVRSPYKFRLGKGESKVSLKDFKGKTLVMYFGFTYCPDVCPTSISFISKVFKKINSPDLVFLFVSVDYKRDTMDTVKNYVEYYNKEFRGATGTKQQIDSMTKNFGIYYRFIEQADSRMKYTVDHTSRFIVIDKKQNWVDSIHSESTLEDTIERIQAHL